MEFHKLQAHLFALITLPFALGLALIQSCSTHDIVDVVFVNDLVLKVLSTPGIYLVHQLERFSGSIPLPLLSWFTM